MIISSLKARQQQWKEEEAIRIANMPDPSVPPGHTLMPRDERLQTLASLQKSNLFKFLLTSMSVYYVVECLVLITTTKKIEWPCLFNSFVLCPLSLTIKLNFNVRKSPFNVCLNLISRLFRGWEEERHWEWSYLKSLPSILIEHHFIPTLSF